MTTEDKYKDCVSKLQECVELLKDMNKELGRLIKVPSEDIDIIEECLDEMETQMEQSKE